MVSVILSFILGIAIGYALTRAILYYYIKWLNKYKKEDVLSNKDISKWSWEYSIYYGIICVFLFLPDDLKGRVLMITVGTIVWFIIVATGVYTKHEQKQLMLYQEEIRNCKDLPINEMSLQEINFWTKTLKKDKKRLEIIIKGAKKNNYKKIVRDAEEKLKQIDDDLETLAIAKTAKGKTRK